MVRHLPVRCMLVTGLGTLVHVASLIFRLLVSALAADRHGWPRRELYVSSLISATQIYFLRRCVGLHTQGLTMRWSERRTVVRSLFEMTSTFPLRATRALVRRRSSCSR